MKDGGVTAIIRTGQLTNDCLQRPRGLLCTSLSHVQSDE
jgi:hypothetical protein